MSAQKEYTVEEISQHQSDDSRWLIIDDKVYDVTKFLDDHPGGAKPLKYYSGKDATQNFHGVAKHEGSDHVPSYLKEFCIGSIKK